MLKFIFLFLFATMLFGDDWPAWRGSYGDAISREKGILKSWPASGPKKIWRIPFGPGYSSVSIAGSKVFSCMADYKYDYCVALDIKTGRQIWKKRIDYAYKDGNGLGPRATPAISDGKLYVISGNGHMWCFDIEKAKAIWKVDLSKMAKEVFLWGYSSSPIVYKDKVFFNAGGKDGKSIIALDKNTGKLLWSCADDQAAYSTPIIAKIFGQDQAIFFTGERVLGIEPQKGKILWFSKWITSNKVHVATPIYNNNHILITSGYDGGASLVQIHKKDKGFNAIQVKASSKLKTHFSSSVLWKNHVYGFHNAILKCMEFKTFRKKWSKRGFGKGSLVVIDDHLIVFGELGILALVELNSKKFIEKGRAYPFPGTNRCLTPPSISDGKLFLRNQYEILCMDLCKR